MKKKREYKVLRYCYRCMCHTDQCVLPSHYSPTIKYMCSCGKINSDPKDCHMMAASWK